MFSCGCYLTSVCLCLQRTILKRLVCMFVEKYVTGLKYNIRGIIYINVALVVSLILIYQKEVYISHRVLNGCLMPTIGLLQTIHIH